MIDGGSALGAILFIFYTADIEVELIKQHGFCHAAGWYADILVFSLI